eukprot:1906072-Rhodomonas_salina.1
MPGGSVCLGAALPRIWGKLEILDSVAWFHAGDVLAGISLQDVDELQDQLNRREFTVRGAVIDSIQYTNASKLLHYFLHFIVHRGLHVPAVNHEWVYQKPRFRALFELIMRVTAQECRTHLIPQEGNPFPVEPYINVPRR